jgi:hypothetical protein
LKILVRQSKSSAKVLCRHVLGVCRNINVAKGQQAIK